MSWNVRSGRQLEGSESEFLGSGRQILGSHSGYGHGCCSLVFNPSTLLALLAGIALATYFLRLVIVVEQFGGRSFAFELGSGFSSIMGLHASEEKFQDLENVSEAIYENSVDSKEDDSWPGWVGGLVAELVELYRQETEEMKEEEKSIREE